MRKVIVKAWITHQFEIELEDDATGDDIWDEAWERAQERLMVSWEYL